MYAGHVLPEATMTGYVESFHGMEPAQIDVQGSKTRLRMRLRKRRLESGAKKASPSGS
jgi:hypothetical protein